MPEHTMFRLMAFGPVVFACLGVLLLIISWLAYRDEKSKNVPINHKVHIRVITVGILLMIPGIFLLLGKLTVMLMTR